MPAIFFPALRWITAGNWKAMIEPDGAVKCPNGSLIVTFKGLKVVTSCDPIFIYIDLANLNPQ